MTLRLNSTGGGHIEIDAPNTASAFSVTMPTTAGEIIVGDSSGDLPTLNVTGDLAFNSGYGSAATAYGCRAYVSVNMTTSPGTINRAQNVSSVTRLATGQYQVNFATSMPDSNYCAFGCHNHWGGVTVNTTMSTTNTTATDVGILTTRADNGTAFNTTLLNIGVIR